MEARKWWAVFSEAQTHVDAFLAMAAVEVFCKLSVQ